MNLTIGKLKEMIKDLPDDMEVVGWSDYYPGIADAECSGVSTGIFRDSDETIEYFVVDGN